MFTKYNQPYNEMVLTDKRRTHQNVTEHEFVYGGCSQCMCVLGENASPPPLRLRERSVAVCPSVLLSLTERDVSNLSHPTKLFNDVNG